MAGRAKRICLILLVCAVLGTAAAARAYNPVIGDSTTMFYAFMDDYGHSYTEWDDSSGDTFCKTFKDNATYAGYGWDAAYTLTMQGRGSEYEGRMTEISYDAALERTFAPGKTDIVLQHAYEAFLAAAGSQFNDSRQFESLYGASRVWPLLQQGLTGDLDHSRLSASLEGWDINMTLVYGENEMHFYFIMYR